MEREGLLKGCWRTFRRGAHAPMLTGMRDPIADAVADVLNEQDVEVARALLAEAVLAATGAELAVRVSVRPGHHDAVMRIHGAGFRPAAEHLPSADDVRKHPLYRFRSETGERGTTTLLDVVRSGWRIDEATRAIFDALRISMHQTEVSVSASGEYSGWTLIAPSAISAAQLRVLAEHEALLRGLDRHIELLAELRALAPLEPASPAVPLTPRELMVLRLMATSCTAAAIAARLGVSPRTVHKHQEHLYRKLGARDRLEAVLVGQRSGLLPALQDGAQAAGARVSAASPPSRWPGPP